MAVLRSAALEDGLAPLHPLDGGCGAEEDLLRLEAPGAGVEDHTFSISSAEMKG